jgi:hypothetical protein
MRRSRVNQGSADHAGGSDDQPVGRISMKRLGESASLDRDMR